MAGKYDNGNDGKYNSGGRLDTVRSVISAGSVSDAKTVEYKDPLLKRIVNALAVPGD